MRPRVPVLPSTVGIMNLLVAAHRALLRSLSTCLWDPPAEGEIVAATACRGWGAGGLQQHSVADTSSHPDVVCPIRRRLASVCGRSTASAWRHRAACPHALTNHQWSGTSLLDISGHAQVALRERLTSPCTITVGYSAVFSATFILYRPIRSHRVFRWSEPAYACVRVRAGADLLQCWDERAHEFIRLQLRRAAAGSCAVARCCQEAEWGILWGGLLLMSMACLLTA